MNFTKPTRAQLQHRVEHHPPVGDQAMRYAQVRASILQAADDCVFLTPCSPEQSRALNALDEAMFLFNAAIAREQPLPAAEAPSVSEILNDASTLPKNGTESGEGKSAESPADNAAGGIIGSG